MKKRVVGAALLLAVTLCVAGCQKQPEAVPEYDESKQSMYVAKDGTIRTTTVGTFNQDYYDVKEYKEFVQVRVDAFNKINDSLAYSNEDQTVVTQPVAIKSIDQKGQTVTEILNYSSATSYLLFNEEYQNLGEGFYFETCLTGNQTGDTSKASFISATDSTAVEKDKALEVAAKEKNMTYIVGINFDAELVTEGNILYISDSDSIELTDKNAVSIHMKDDQPVYIIYR